MINNIIQTIIENKDFLEKSIRNNEISLFSRDLEKYLMKQEEKHLWEF